MYILHFPKVDVVNVSYGLSRKMEERSIYHTCSTDFGSSGSPILSLKKFKVLGIHSGRTKFEYNQGTFLKYAIDEFFKKIDNISNLNPFQIIKENNLEKLKKLYNYNKYILTQKDEHVETLLHCSIKSNNYEITKFLLEKGKIMMNQMSMGLLLYFLVLEKLENYFRVMGLLQNIFALAQNQKEFLLKKKM